MKAANGAFLRSWSEQVHAAQDALRNASAETGLTEELELWRDGEDTHLSLTGEYASVGVRLAPHVARAFARNVWTYEAARARLAALAIGDAELAREIEAWLRISEAMWRRAELLGL